MRKNYLTPKLKEQQTVDLAQFGPRERVNIRMYGLKCKNWTPLDVTDYKRKWLSAAEEVIVNRDMLGLDQCVVWCKNNLFHQDFQVKKYANPDDSHVIKFKRPEDAMMFKLSL